MTVNEILEELKYGEHIHLECKKAESQIPNSVWETYSSFAQLSHIKTPKKSSNNAGK